MKEKSKSGKTFMRLEYMSGDDDHREYDDVEIEGVTLENYKERTSEMEKEIEPYITLSEALQSELSYDEIMEQHGEEVAGLYQTVPWDITSDYNRRAALTGITIVVYDAEGNMYESNDMIN
jgi:hypothetical protein